MLKYLTVVISLVVFLLYGLDNNTLAKAQVARSHIKTESNNSLQYRVWRVFDEDRRGFTIVVISVDSRNFNRPDMTALAARLKQEFAAKARLKIGLLDDAHTARLFVEGRVNYATYEKAERGRYYLDRTTCREYIQFSIRRGKPRTTMPIKCSVSKPHSLSNGSRPCGLSKLSRTVRYPDGSF